MKKLLGILLIAVLAYCGHAQTADKAYLLNARTIGVGTPSVKATRDFWKRAGEGKNEQWYKLSQGGLLAVYTENGIQGRYFYDKSGYWVYSIQQYSEKQLPADIRKLVRSTYFDYSIGWVQEINQRRDLVYVVHIEDEKKWKDLIVADGEITVWKEFDK